MGAASAGVQSPQSSMPAGKGAGASPSTPAGSTNSTTYPSTSGQPTMGAPNTNSNTGMNVAPAGKGGGSLANAAMPSSPHIDESGNPIVQMPGVEVPAGKGGSSMASPSTPATGTLTSPYIAEPQSFQNRDASGNLVSPMRVPSQYSNTVGAPNEMPSGTPVPTGVSGKGGAAGGSQGKGPQ